MRGDAIRLSFFYAAFFVFAGIHLPFWPVWLAAKGIDAEGIALIIAAGIVVKVAVNPLIAHFADRSGARRPIMLALVLGASMVFAAFFVAEGFTAILLVNLLFLALWAPVMPLGESLTLLAARAGDFDYGRVRLWGSIAFVAAAAGSGAWLAGRPGETVLALLVPAMALVVGAVAAVPDARAPAAVGRPAALELLGDRPFLAMLLACSLVQASHAAYYAFGTLHWRAAGHSETVIGALWAEGVIAEIILFAFGPAVLRRISPSALVALAGAAGIIRWTAVAASEALPVLIVTQALHAFTFGAAHLGAIHFIAQRVSPSVSATAQSYYSATVMGLGLGIAVYAVGPLYAASSAVAFLAMVALSAAALVPALILVRPRD
ncbi:MAG: 3-phenylpropionate MFS transporter [Alphaproteobacteria bacterium]|nr:3-phenylpropionate MFS transporter [Alphaproteobacteria bacterium]MBM3950097.1 3-phenylpropionate MFS transporter [Rhodospirillales bacterium]